MWVFSWCAACLQVIFTYCFLLCISTSTKSQHCAFLTVYCTCIDIVIGALGSTMGQTLLYLTEEVLKKRKKERKAGKRGTCWNTSLVQEDDQG